VVLNWVLVREKNQQQNSKKKEHRLSFTAVQDKKPVLLNANAPFKLELE